MTPNKTTARLAGLFFLLMVAFGLFAEIFFRQKIFVANDAARTAGNILSNEFLYRAGIASDILMSLCYLFTALVLYKLLAPVNKNLAAMMVVLAAAGSIMLLGNIQSEFAPLAILSGNNDMGAFNASQIQALAMQSYQSYQHGYVIGQVFFALWVLPLGILIRSSRFIPGAFGILFILEAFLALSAVFVHFLAPSETIETILMLPGIIAEFSFMFWLLIWGVRESRQPAHKLSYG